METFETTYKRIWVVMTWSIKIFEVILVFKQIQTLLFPFGIFAILQLSTIHEIYQKYPPFCFCKWRKNCESLIVYISGYIDRIKL